MKKNILLGTAFLFSMVPAMANNHPAVNLLLSNNKLIAVNAILLIILLGIFIFLFNQDKRIKKLEDRIK
ncbi:MAG: CcmD family protein [Chitinophagales bacterium]|nr:CcmD family protein [Chitinophagales bacterium]MCZ2394093.1 CcmD family protein [Chitinophagales bacterium]